MERCHLPQSPGAAGLAAPRCALPASRMGCAHSWDSGSSSCGGELALPVPRPLPGPAPGDHPLSDAPSAPPPAGPPPRRPPPTPHRTLPPPRPPPTPPPAFSRTLTPTRRLAGPGYRLPWPLPPQAASALPLLPGWTLTQQSPSSSWAPPLLDGLPRPPAPAALHPAARPFTQAGPSLPPVPPSSSPTLAGSCHFVCSPAGAPTCLG